MHSFAVIEVEDGFEVIELITGQSAEDAAATQGGQLIDPGPYHSYEDANEVLEQLEVSDDREWPTARPRRVNHNSER
ncbi:hypothetical protein Pla52o_29220 [Novipirellula galeiformis]|uniref:Uncharacterized protein n=1 Tax=Novipirellula galeiformis TaxID=2528004 RepID=A0A5C6CJW2_9BACT|nr:hypothetical protein [Novipirellula galeiformis]TWU23386.1 hypothetical protein Pla52o_29220 [Novipirellula galeiformis]